MNHSPYAPGPVFGLKRKSPRLNDRKGNISLNITLSPYAEHLKIG